MLDNRNKLEAMSEFFYWRAKTQVTVLFPSTKRNGWRARNILEHIWWWYLLITHILMYEGDDKVQMLDYGGLNFCHNNNSYMVKKFNLAFF